MKFKNITYEQERSTQMWKLLIDGVVIEGLYSTIRDRDIAISKIGA